MQISKSPQVLNEKSQHNPFDTMNRKIDGPIWNIPQSHKMQRQEHAVEMMLVPQLH